LPLVENRSGDVGGHTCGKARSVDLELNAGEVDVTSRDSQGWNEYLQGLKNGQATVDQLWVPTDSGIVAIQAAYEDGTLLACEFKDKDGAGYSANCIITKLSNPQPLDGAVGFNVTLRITGKPTRLAETS
jgi:predicted secreted protein